MQTAFRDETMGQAQVFWWFQLSDRQMSVKCDKYLGILYNPQSNANDDSVAKVLNLLQNDSKLIADEARVYYGSHQAIS